MEQPKALLRCVTTRGLLSNTLMMMTLFITRAVVGTAQPLGNVRLLMTIPLVLPRGKNVLELAQVVAWPPIVEKIGHALTFMCWVTVHNKIQVNTITMLCRETRIPVPIYCCRSSSVPPTYSVSSFHWLKWKTIKLLVWYKCLLKFSFRLFISFLTKL